MKGQIWKDVDGRMFWVQQDFLRGKAWCERSLLTGSSTELMMSHSKERGANV